ncbi:MAG: hypothetical protein NC328_07775 [Muribaculum sp.]|nr:hypothetical protein [Muribaculum sp.]
MLDITLDLSKHEKNSRDHEVMEEAMAARKTAAEMLESKRNVDALERVVSALRTMREYSDFENLEFKTLLIALLFDLSEIHFALKDYKQSEKELDTLFKLLSPLVQSDPDRFARFHILAMELSTRVLRSRKKTLDMLVKQQIDTEQLYEKVNSGVTAATDKLVESLRKVGQLLASTGDYRGAMKFLAEAIKISKKRTGRVTRKEIKMTIEMAEIMMRVGSMRPRARRLLGAILPHAISQETIELEEEILALCEILDNDVEKESKWKNFIYSLTHPRAKSRRKAEEGGVEDAPADKMANEVKGAEEKTEGKSAKSRKSKKKKKNNKKEDKEEI